jgi:hypothetical protein
MLALAIAALDILTISLSLNIVHVLSLLKKWPEISGESSNISNSPSLYAPFRMLKLYPRAGGNR